MPTPRPALAVFLLLALTGFALLSLYLLRPPAPKPANTPATAFSAARAMVHVRQIAREPHAMGTAAHASVRNYLLGQMQALGLNPQVQEATAVNGRNGAATVGYVYNVLGRLPGTNSDGKAILLMAHYDSQPNARGAGDDGAGVAAILETVRALQQAAPLQHDVIVLLTDGEEYGLYGARAFLKHPWAKDVALVMNLEGRGAAGPSMTFELSPENGWLAKQYIQHAPYPFVSSLAYEIYRRMPNDTDFTVFKNEGYSGLNAAFIDGFVHYHKATDSPENLSQRSLQQHGSNLLALVRHFGVTSLAQTKAPDSVFFNAVGGRVITYPQGLNILWVLLTTVLLIVALVVGVRSGAFTVGQLLIGFFVFVVMVAMVVGVFIPINGLLLDRLPLSHRSNGVYSADTFFVAYVTLALGLFLFLSWLVLRWLRVFALVMGALLLQFILSLVIYFTIPSATYLLLFPLLFCLAGVLVVLIKKLHEPLTGSWPFAIILLLASLPAIFILMPIVHVVFVAFGLQLPIGSVALFVLLLGFLLPLLYIVEHNLRWGRVPLLPLLLLVLGFVLLVLGLQQEKPSAEQPLHSHVSYYLNADSGKAYWASSYTTTDDWNRQFFKDATQGPLSELYPHATLNYLKSAAGTVALAPPVATVVADAVVDGKRMLRLQLSSQRDAAHLELVLQTPDPTAITGIKLAGEELELKPVAAGSGEVYFTRLHGLPQNKQVTLELALKPDAPLTLHLYDQTIGLPQQLITTPKPAHVIAESGGSSNLTVVRKSYTF